MANIGNHTFIDGVGDIRLREGIVRMDLLALSPTQRDEEGNPVPQFVEQIVMSPHAFLRMVSALGDTLKQMQEKGMLGSGDSNAAADSETKEPAVKKSEEAKEPPKSGSPNF